MFGISFPELAVVAFIALLVLGPERLPEAMRTLGKWVGMGKKTADSVRREFYNAVYTPAKEIKSSVDLAARELRSVAKDPLCPDTQKKLEAKSVENEPKS